MLAQTHCSKTHKKTNINVIEHITLLKVTPEILDKKNAMHQAIVAMHQLSRRQENIKKALAYINFYIHVNDQFNVSNLRSLSLN